MNRLWKDGDPWIWLTGGALAMSLIMVVGLVGLILVSGMGYFWPKDVTRFVLRDGKAVLGEITDREVIPVHDAPKGTPPIHRILVKQGNRDLLGNDFVWLDEAAVARRELPPEAVVLERLEYGNLYGSLKEVREAGTVVGRGPEEGWKQLHARLPDAHAVLGRIEKLEKDEIGDVNAAQEKIRLRLKGLDLKGVKEGPEVRRLKEEMAGHQARFTELQKRIADLRKSLNASVVITAEGGQEKEVPLAKLVRATRPNAMGVFGKAWFYASKFWEFIWDDPRESNTEGGIFPAIFGTVMMVMIMSLFVTPLGVLAALYLREYAKQGTFVSIVRIAVNNLAGVPSIVFGVFGVGFLIYFVGGKIDEWFFPEMLPTPTFGTGGILWASLTLALLTVPVVIVATEEGLASIPKGLREASLALGATKWETTWKVVLPSLMPSILTGLILAMARAAGEVAPLMITGVVKLAPTLALDGTAPFLHADRKFMHLGFHIYDVGFQSPNVDAARPMVFATAFLLIMIVVALNLTAIVLRKRLRKRFAGSAL
ncbi:MAG TPA: phosphate ABC transporter permease PstA [Planctomycetota bacterium]|nr:phosphate ABC transporter permease PstA [Planctomycetota bacterium]